MINWLKDKWYALVAPLIVAGVVMLFAGSQSLQQLENMTIDWRFDNLRELFEIENSDNLFLIEVDQASIDALGGWPWPRNAHGGLVFLLADVELDVLGIDIIFSDRREAERDLYLAGTVRTDPDNEYLAESLKKIGRVVLAGYAQAEGTQLVREGTIDLGVTRPIESVQGEIMEVPGTNNLNRLLVPLPLLRFDTVTGFTDASPFKGNDTTRRYMPMVVRIKDDLYASFDLQMLLRHWDTDVENVTVELGNEIRVTTPKGVQRIPINEQGELLINYREHLQVESASFHKIAEALYAHEREGQPLPDDFPDLKDKIVIIAVTVGGLMDSAVTPTDASIPPVYTHFQALNNILTGDYIRYADEGMVLLFFVAVCWLTLLPFHTERILFMIGIPLLTVLGFTVIALYLFNLENTIVPYFWPVSGFILVHSGSILNNWIKQIYSKQQLKNVFSSYIAPTVMDQLLDDPDNIKLGGIRKPVTILFSDVRGFTTISESMDEEALVQQLNEYFGQMVDAVNEHQGTLHKYIGDAIMVVWGDVVSHSVEDDARQAVRASLKMRRKLMPLNEKWEKAGQPKFRIGIGLNHGTVLVGNIGAEQRQEFTVIGDAVNLASRLEGVTKQYDTDLIIGETVYDLLDGEFLCRPVGSLVVQGKSKPVRAYEVLEESAASEPQWSKAWVEKYTKAFDDFLGRRFEAARDGFEACLKEKPDDNITRDYLEAARTLIMFPPPDDWDGSVTLRSK
jgi:adenylate cyclase